MVNSAPPGAIAPRAGLSEPAYDRRRFGISPWSGDCPMAKSFVPVVCIIGLMIVPAWAAQKPVGPSVSRPVVKDGGGSPDKPASETKVGGGKDGVQPQSGPQKPAPGTQ